MNKIAGISSFFFLLSISMQGKDINDVMTSLKNEAATGVNVELDVQLPTGTGDPIVYDIKLLSQAAQNDLLSPLEYLIDWTLPTPIGKSHGFSAYFNKNLYKFRDGSKLLEYHYENDSVPFLTGVQNNVQFLDLFPFYVADEIKNMLNDSTFTLKFYPDTLFQGKKVDVLKTKRVISGIEAGNNTYVFDAVTSYPVFIEKEMSPGSISEQIITVRYKDEISGAEVPVTEDSLIELYPEVFSQYREGYYRLKNMEGKHLPSFSLPGADSNRFSYNKGDQLASITLLVFLDETVASTPDVISTLRSSISNLPTNVDIIWIFLSNRTDDINDTVGQLLPGERLLLSGRTVVKDFGVNESPSIVIAGRDGVVKNVITEYSNNLSNEITEKIAFIK